LLVLCIILLLLLLFLILPVGVHLRCEDDFSLKLQIGPLGIPLLPRRKAKAEKVKAKKPKEKKEKPKLTVRDLLDLAAIGMKALGRLRRSLSIDLFRLHVLVSAADPYDAVLRYGALNAGLGALSPAAHKALRIRTEDVQTAVDVQGGEGRVTAELKATLQIWEILWIALCAGIAFLKWRAARKKAAKMNETSNETIREEKAS